MKAQIALRKIGGLMMAVSLLLFAAYLFFYRQIVRFVELYFSPDQQMTPNGQRIVISTLVFLTFLLFGAGFGFWKSEDRAWFGRLKQVFVDEPLLRFAGSRSFNRPILILSSLAGLFLVVSMLIGYRFPAIFELLYKKDHGVLDLAVPVLMIASAALLGAAVARLWKEPKMARYRLFLSVVYLAMIVLFVFDVGEETSWGQDFFHWQTPAAFAGNLEDQTNVHNYFNSYFDYVYLPIALVAVVILVSAWSEFTHHWLPLNRLLLPHPSLIGLGLLIAFVAIVWYSEQELLEEMVAMFILFYSIRMFRCFRSEALTLEG